MTVDERVRKTLAELGVARPGDIHHQFTRVREAVDDEFYARVQKGALNEDEKAKICEEFRIRWLGRESGIVAKLDENWLKPASKDWKPVVGKFFNDLRRHVTAQVGALRDQIRVGAPVTVPSEASGGAQEAPADLTLPGYRRPLGSIHPITRVQREIEDIFLGLGFSIETGPEVESVHYNFDALNIPENHPARDDMDTLYVDPQTVLRTHTSPVQIRSMEKYGAPLYIIVPGKVYRRDNPDASHSPMFHQIEGLAVDEHITFADLKGTLDYFAKKFFGEKVRTLFHPTFFPFTEPSGQMAISCTICDGRGCRTCKQSGWLEVMGCGMVHPDVLSAGGVDSERYSGWAFGLGVDRFAMMKYDISDIQLFFQSDVRFLEQF